MGKKLKTEHLKYIVLNKQTNKANIYRYKSKVARDTNISTRTLDRKIPYENEFFKIVLTDEVII